MSCTSASLTQGHTPKSCKDPAGVAEILLTDYANITFPVTKTSGVVTAITMASGKQFFKYKQKAEAANWKQEATVDAKNGTKSYTQTITLDVLGLDQATQTELELLVSATTAAIVKLNDGSYWFVADDTYGLDTTADALDSGTAMNDFMGDKITISGKTKLRAASVNSALIASLLIPQSP